MTQTRVDELEAMKPGELPNDQEYFGGHGLRVKIRQQPNMWFQTIGTEGLLTTIKLGWTKRVLLDHALEVGSNFKKWASEHTKDECHDAAEMFRKYAKTEVDGERLSLKVLRSSLGRAIGLHESAHDEAAVDTSSRQHNRILYGPPGTGKTFDSILEAIKTIDDHLPEDRARAKARFDKLEERKQVQFVTFHQNYAYEDFIEGIRPVLDKKKLRYERRDGIFKLIAQRAKRDPSNRYVLIIDEINRGNVAKIFGELITLIESSKRLGAEDEARATLPYSQDQFGVPNNLYLIGTMNTADRGIALLDVALRRRFNFTARMPDASHVQNNIEGVDGRKLLLAVNERIVENLDRDHQIGHTYFMGVRTLAQLKGVFQNQVIPLLQEYFYDDWERMRRVLNESDFLTKREGTERQVFDVLAQDDERWLRAESYQAIYSGNGGAADEE